MASLFKNWKTTSERIDKYLSDKYFTDVNLSKIITADVKQLTKIDHLKIVTNPKLSTKDSLELYDNSALTVHEAINSDLWETVEKETFMFGNTWSIHWFRLEFDVPIEWEKDKENYVTELHWNSECEVLLVNAHGNIIQGFNSTHSRTSVDVSNIDPALPDRRHHVVFLQASCNELFGAGNNGLINAPNLNKSFKIATAQLQLTFMPAITAHRDLKLLLSIAEALPHTEHAYQAVHVANHIINLLVDMTIADMHHKLIKARHLLDEFFSGKSGSDRLTLHAIGHCHIDTAWLWRYGETRRKIARSWSTTVGLLERHPNMTFVCSQAQQMEWLKKDYPDLFLRIKKLFERKQFVPVGGTWVEMDVNLPCCESLCRQFLFGQKFYKENFGQYCHEFWLPDTFGYSPQLPQIMKQSRISRFMTQKLSWSLVNKFPHHTFIWQGLDGSRVLTHFPPGDSYSMTCNVSEILRSVTNYSDKGRTSSVMYVYGHGDGGQGPTEDMVYTLDRLKDYDGLPRISHSTPDRFYSEIEIDKLDNLCTWDGELFLELHNGTYTTQRQLKLGNHHCEQMMRAVEMLISIIILSQSHSEKGDHTMSSISLILDQVEIQWKLILLGQFHDVLPGSSIEQVCDDAYWSHRAVLDWCADTIQTLASMLNITSPFLINPTSWSLSIPNISGSLVIPAHSIMTASEVPIDNSISVDYQFDSSSKLHIISNRFFTISVDNQCRIQQLRLLSHPDFMNIISDDDYGNQLVMYDDVPLFWDAWDVMDYHLETGTHIDLISSFRILQEAKLTKEKDSLKLVAKFCLENTQTVIEQSVTVYDNAEFCQMSSKIEWHETHRMIKIKIPTVIRATDAQYHTQAGYHSRPTHRNTSWDAAKFEVCGHSWIHLGEVNWGVGILKESIFGSSVIGGNIFLSLLRSPTSPDATADKKYLPHIFNYAIYPYDCSSSNVNKFATISRLATHFNWISAWNSNLSNDFFSKRGHHELNQVCSFPIYIASPHNGEVSIDWIKPMGNDPRQIVVRLHEQTGGRYQVKLNSLISIKRVSESNILEEIQESRTNVRYSIDSIDLFMCPFVILSIIVDFV